LLVFNSCSILVFSRVKKGKFLIFPKTTIKGQKKKKKKKTFGLGKFLVFPKNKRKGQKKKKKNTTFGLAALGDHNRHNYYGIGLQLERERLECRSSSVCVE